MTAKTENNRKKWRPSFFVILVLSTALLIPQARALFSEMGLRWLYILCISFGLSYCLTPIFKTLALKLEIIDNPDVRKRHLQGTPLMGGAAVFIAFTIAIFVNNIYNIRLLSIMAGAFLLFVVGTADDVTGISAGIKLLTQIISTCIIMAAGIILRIAPAGWGFISDVTNIIITVIWIVWMTNAMNFFDGMDGLATGLGAIVSFFIGIMAFQTHQPFIGWVAIAMLGTCSGFLPYNFKSKGNAEIFLGDAGSTVIGFILASAAVYGDWAQNNPIIAFVSPLLIFWVMIFDMIHITIDRMVTGKISNIRQWLEYVGNDHLHHRLAVVLGGKKKSVLFIYLLSLCFGLDAILLRHAETIDALLLVLQAVCMVLLITFLERRGRTIKENMTNGKIQ
jgi:UDP-GlcNAc:undecaprenyl-phosphate GlcNAc-1-phosphate transferase